jgi:hypothetical protein
MQAIITKYIGPSNSRGARIRATWKRFDGPVSLTIAYPYDLSDRDAHAAAAMALVRKYTDGGNDWNAGELPNGNYVFTMLGEAFSRYFGA